MDLAEDGGASTLEEDVDKFLKEIERKYSTTSIVSSENDLEQQLHVLSQEFATFGLDEIKVNQSTSELLRNLVDRSLSLIEMHRRTLSQVTNISICNKSKDSRNGDLEKTITDLQTKLQFAKDKNVNLNRDIYRKNSTITELNKMISDHNDQMNRIKQFYKSQLNKLALKVQSLEGENAHLRHMCGTNIDKYFSKEDRYLSVLKTHRENESVYKTAIQKLEDNNTEIMNEILNLKNELALAYLKQN